MKFSEGEEADVVSDKRDAEKREEEPEVKERRGNGNEMHSLLKEYEECG